MNDKNYFLKPSAKSQINRLKKLSKQECIPVGCVPSAAVAVCSGGGEGVPAPGGGEGGVCSGGCLVPGRGVVSQHALRQTPLWTDRQV